MNNKILRIGKMAFSLTQYFIYIIMALSLVIGLYLLIKQGENMPSWLNLSTKEINLINNNNTQQMAVPSVSKVNFYLLKTEAFLLLTVLIVNQIIQIINSVSKRDVFGQANVASLRKIGTLFLLLFIVNIFNTEIADSEFSTIKFHFNPVYLLGSILSYMLAEIFLEGHKIYEENKLTI
ncbi:MAG: hypothetical protein ACJAT1_000134 [Marivirga sp.]|jgi:hypothetical protein